MKYERPALGDPNVKTIKAKAAFGPKGYPLPDFDKPISSRENFFRVAKRDNPMWIPFCPSEFQELHMSHISTGGPEGHQLGPDLSSKENRYQYFDAFGNSWTFDKNAGGACMTYGTRICDDILKWEEQVPFPDLHEYKLEETAEKWMKEEYDPNRITVLDIYHGPFQAMADVMGGFAEALEAMFVEPEASAAFLNRFADWMIWLMDKLASLYPVDMYVVHDDWGTEKDTFFSPDMMRELLFEPTKRMIDHAHENGKLYMFHCCGKIERFMPAFCELGADFMQLQRRVNDVPKYKELYGDKIGFNAQLEGMEMGKQYTDEEFIQIIRDNIKIYGKYGGFYPSSWIMAPPSSMWAIASELYCGSREYYEGE